MQDWKEAAAESAREAANRSRPPWIGQREWDKEYMRTIASRISKRDMERIIYYCREEGITRYRLIKELLDGWLERMEKMYS